MELFKVYGFNKNGVHGCVIIKTIEDKQFITLRAAQAGLTEILHYEKI